jgi:hypothetical protein
MARFQTSLTGDPKALVAHLDAAILGGSVTADRDEATEQRIGDAGMMVLVYERYSAMGGNRLSLTVSILAVGQELAVTMVSAGGSQALFFKINTFGEGTFLNKGRQALESFSG